MQSDKTMNVKLRRLASTELPKYRYNPIDEETLASVKQMLDAVRKRGNTAVREFAAKFSEVEAHEPLVIEKAALQAAAESLDANSLGVLQRTADRIRRFAEAQLRSIQECSLEIPGGRAGTRICPIQTAGCYAPGGRYPLPSSVLMTAVTARVAGVGKVWVASPRPNATTLAAAFVAGADGVIPVGGAHAIAAMAYGADPIPTCDIIVGPGNRWVTAAKQLVVGTVGIDMLAGPSELVVIADEKSNPALVAADMLAQAEHDTDALAILVLLGKSDGQAFEQELERQLSELPTEAVARQALQNGFIVPVTTIDEAVTAVNLLAPEHLQLHVKWNREDISRLKHYGALFIGEKSAEVLGDYGAGPNHVLPTSGTARFTAGLSVLTFLRSQTWLEIDDCETAKSIIQDARALADLEGLFGHERSARGRLE